MLAQTDVLWVHSMEKFNLNASYLGLFFLSIVLFVFFYLTFYLPRKKIQVDMLKWQQSAPRAIPLASLASVCAFFSYTVALWPVYHILTIPMELVMLLGFITLVTFF